MATESPIRIIETGGKWPSHNDAVRFGPSSANMAIEELGLLLKSQRFQGNGGRDLVPNRSGSAPPNMEGSFAAIENLMSQQYLTSNPSLESLNINNATIGRSNYMSEEQLRADPAYVAYYWSNVNLNPRLPPPLMSWENRGLVRHSRSSSGNNGVRLTSFDDSSTNGSLRIPLGNLPTHKEESEDDRSPQPVPDDWAEKSGGFWSGGADEAAASPAQLKSLVDLIQEDFPRTPSPVYNQARSLSHESAEEAVTYDADSGSLHDPPSIRTSNAITSSTFGADDIGQSSYSDSSIAPISSSPSLDSTVDVRGIESGKNSISISRNRNSESQMKKQDRQQHIHQSTMLQEHINRQPSTTFQVLGGVHPQMISQGGVSHHTYIGANQFLHGPTNSFSAAEVQPVLQSSYGSAAAAYMMTSANPFHPNLQPSGYFSPQYNVGGGYAFNSTALSPYVAAGYLPHSAVPLPFDATAGPTFSSQTSGPSTPGVDMQYLNRFYSQLGFPMQPSFPDPLQMQQYFQPPPPPFGDTQQKGSELAAAYSAEQKFHSNVNPRGVGVTSSPFYVGSPTNMGVFHQFPTSPIAASPQILPGSPVGGRNEVRLSPGSVRTAGIYNEWQGQRGGLVSFDDSKMYSFLEELKSGKGRRFELSDISGHIVEFSADQHGSRFIQQKLEICSLEEKQSVFKEVLPLASKLMTDVFGNYVIQKFFEYGSPEQRKELANQLEDHILPLSLQMYGCRVIQKALEVIELEQKCKLVHELDGHVLRCVRDQNGNHVIQKCIECIPTPKIDFIISSFRDQVAILSTHPYGCRVIQRVLEHCTDELQSQFIVDEILESVCALAQDQYGNYVTQHVLERGKAYERNQIISKLSGRFVQLSQHKFASNVVEKCLEYGDSSTREILIGEIVGADDGQDNLLTMVKDQYANYVVQKILQTCTVSEREMLLSRIRIHLNSLKKYTYGKHIVARFEQLYGEELQSQQLEDHR